MDTIDMTRELIDNILNGKASSAQDNFEDIISVKATEILGDRKQTIAQSLYNSSSEQDYAADAGE